MLPIDMNEIKRCNRGHCGRDPRGRENGNYYGKSGAGKSTLIQLLLGAITATEGDIKINGCSPQQY